jgi:hypothetical protein
MAVMCCALFLLLALLATLTTALQTFELVLHRYPLTTICTDARIRETQRNRVLERNSTANYITSSRVVPSHDGSAILEEVHIFAHGETVLAEHFGDLCSNREVLQVSVEKRESHKQFVLSPSSTSRDVDIPSFDIREISGSGPSYNRVDLMFFADGCTSVNSILISERLM